MIQISNQLGTESARAGQAAPSPIKKGEVRSLLIKETLSGTDAVGIMKGQTVKVQFADGVPETSPVMVEAGEIQEDGSLSVSVQKETTSGQESEPVESALTKAGYNPEKSSALKQAAELVSTNGGKLTKEVLQALNDFLTEEPGSVGEKLDTIKAVLKKNLEPTGVQLHSVYQALHGKNFTNSLKQLANELGITLDFNSGKHQSNQSEKNLINASAGKGEVSEMISRVLDALKTQELDTATIDRLKDMLHKINQIDATASEMIEDGNTDGEKLQSLAKEKLVQALSQLGIEMPVEGPKFSANPQGAEQFQAAVKAVGKEASLPAVFEAVQELIGTGLESEKLSVSLEKSEKLFNQGRELAARSELAGTLSEMEAEHPELRPQDQQALTETETYDINQALQSIGVDSKNIIVTKITEKLSQMAIDFKQMKLDVMKNLSQSASFLDAGQGAAAKQTLETAISRIDQALLKGDYLLYTNMAEEKQLLTASTRLSQARAMLEKGNYPGAAEIVNEVKKTIDGITFKPSDIRVKHFVSEQSLLQNASGKEQLSRQLESAIKPFPGEEPSARQVFETVRRLGLTHESDTARNLLSAKQAEEQNNLKASLLKLMHTETGGAAEQTVANLTGQQLLSRSDFPGAQQLMMQLPFLLDKQVENVKVYVNSQKQGGTLDWENCSLYFVLDTKKMGEVGIMLNAQNRNLSLTFKNDNGDFENKMEPLVKAAANRLEEIGYKAGSIQFKPFTADEAAEGGTAKTNPLRSNGGQKGYDFTI